MPGSRTDSVHAPGVSGWYGPPGPNLRSANASTAAAIVGKCGGQNAWKVPSVRPVGLGVPQRGSVS